MGVNDKKINISGRNYEFSPFTMPFSKKEDSTTYTSDLPKKKEEKPATKQQKSPVSVEKNNSNVAARNAADIQPFIPNITKEEDNMHYSCDAPSTEKKEKPVKQEDSSFKVEGIPNLEKEVIIPISERKVIPDFSGLITKTEKKVVNILEGNSNDINNPDNNRYPFMTELQRTAEKAGYGIYWKENVALNGQLFIGGYLTMNSTRVPNKSFMIDLGNIYNRILKIFMMKDGFFIEGCNGYPLYGFDRETKTQFFNEQVIFNLFKGGEDAVNQKDACYKGMDKTINSFVDMISVDNIKNKSIKKAIKDRLFAALKADVFSDPIAQSFNRFRIDPESIITASDDTSKVRFIMLNDAPKHFGEVPVQHNMLRMNFTFNNMSIDVL